MLLPYVATLLAAARKRLRNHLVYSRTISTGSF